MDIFGLDRIPLIDRIPHLMSSLSVPQLVALPILCPFELELEHNILQDQFDMTHEDQTSMYQNECLVGKTWCAFKSIKTVQLDKNFTMAFSLEWENKESIDHTVLISAKELQHHRKTTEWARRFDIWAQTNAPNVGETYTWDDLHVHVELETGLKRWLNECALGQLVPLFKDKQCLSKASLLYLSDELLQRWGLSTIMRRYTLKCVKTEIEKMR